MDGTFQQNANLCIRGGWMWAVTVVGGVTIISLPETAPV